MGIHIAIEHRTTYRFDRSTHLFPHVLRLRPAAHSRTPILSYSLQVAPVEHFVNWQQDPFGNYLARLVFPEPTRELDIVVDLLADMTVVNPFDFFVEESATHYPFEYDPQLRGDLEPYLRPATEHTPLLDTWVRGVQTELLHASAGSTARPGIADFLVDLNRRLYNDVAYSVRMEPGVQAPDETLDRAIGSCRDTGWLLVEVLRRFGLAARFVSGYLVQLTSDVKALDGPDGPATDFTDLHAWAEVYVPGAGWIGLDPTSGLFAGEGHIPLACTPHPVSAAPITGATTVAEVEFSYTNTVTRVREDPRVTRPYAPEQWAAIDALGHAVDARLAAADVRLTMGGEPTFVSIDDMDGPEWNTAADSPAKRALAGDLAGRLRDRFGPGGVVHHGQGKWYPGEPLPRWEIGIVWRTDGEQLFGAGLLADPARPGTATKADAQAFADALTARLGFPPDVVVPAYEDPVHIEHTLARLPAGAPPLVAQDPAAPPSAWPGAAHAADPRVATHSRLVAHDGAPTGWVLPLHRSDNGRRWQSVRWALRRDALYLVPGDSPVGLRLPLDSFSWKPFPPPAERSPFDLRGALPAPGQAPAAPAAVVEADGAPPAALTCEVRDGHVAVFLPPLQHAEHAVELLGAIEATAAELGTSIVLQGYALPGDARFGRLTVTPDPGVIEVNVQPSATWADLRHVTETLYEQARLARLGTEKFALDGSHTGTGGGNHVTLGGTTPSDSPLLRRPDLLASMLTYWQNHPALSYLFSGQFIGPTSQAPRVDEGRADTVYELEIALAELHRLTDAGQIAAWTTDRLLRHLLVDLTGNTHRAEFCIDKLFSPDSERGRLGLLELRAFEMPPHAEMALVQALLVRALVVRFWETPYRNPLVRWGSDLYDRFLLPWYVRADAQAVVADLNRHGLAFDRGWLEPFLEFRFPLIGETTVEGVHVELRKAIEPWHVLGEEVSGSGTARYVDSSVERLQVRVDDYVPGRYVVTCNGRALPLRPTEMQGTFVAGVRFKAWAPWSALHPTIGSHAPLVFDVVDTWTQRSLGGCTYDVAHPGGRAYDTFPVNAPEAESRRAARFATTAHTPGTIVVTAEPVPTDSPRTLDLRR